MAKKNNRKTTVVMSVLALALTLSACSTRTPIEGIQVTTPLVDDRAGQPPSSLNNNNNNNSNNPNAPMNENNSINPSGQANPNNRLAADSLPAT